MDATDTTAMNEEYKGRLTELNALGFAEVRKKFQAGIRDSMAYSRYLAEESLAQFVRNGNTNWLNDHLHDLTVHAKNFVRPAAFVKWATAHAQLKYENKQLVKDKDRKIDDPAALMAKALTMPYWAFAPDMELVQFGAGDFLAKLDALIKTFEGKHKAPKDEAARNILVEAKRKMAELHRLIPIESIVAATTAAKTEGVVQPVPVEQPIAPASAEAETPPEGAKLAA